jgi:hypothetical protein
MQGAAADPEPGDPDLLAGEIRPGQQRREEKPFNKKRQSQGGNEHGRRGPQQQAQRFSEGTWTNSGH